MCRLSLLNIFFAISLCCYTARAYEIPRVDLKILEYGFQVSIPHEPGLEMVVFNIEINEQCPLLLDLITEQRDNRWISQQPTHKLDRNSNLRINIMAMHEGRLFSRTDRVWLSENGLNYESIKKGDEPIDTCAAQPELGKQSMLKVEKASETKVFTNNILSNKSYKRNEEIFNENFENRQLPKWNKDAYLFSNGIGDKSEDFVSYSSNDDNLVVNKDGLLIKPTPSTYTISGTINVYRCTPPACYEHNESLCKYEKEYGKPYKYPPPVKSARINTKNKFSFQYGRIEINAKLPEGDWLFPYIMLLPDTQNCTYRKQLRIAYATSKDLQNSRIRGGPVVIHGRENPSKRTKIIFDRSSYMAIRGDIKNINDYHNFTLVWTSREIGLYIDNVKFGCIANNGEYDQPYHIVLGVGAGGHLEFLDSSEKPWKNGYQHSFQYFHHSLIGCCAFDKPSPACMEGKIKRKCTKQWGPSAAMAVRSVRVFAV